MEPLHPPYLVLDDNIPGCDHFKWNEVLWLPSWKIYVYPSEVECTNLMKIAVKLDYIRKYLNKPIRVTSGLRPRLYNNHIGGAFNSAHIAGQAIDFKVVGLGADAVRASILPLLSRLEIRMEDLPGANWVHVDDRPVRGRGHRYFKP